RSAPVDGSVAPSSGRRRAAACSSPPSPSSSARAWRGGRSTGSPPPQGAAAGRSSFLFRPRSPRGPRFNTPTRNHRAGESTAAPADGSLAPGLGTVAASIGEARAWDRTPGLMREMVAMYARQPRLDRLYERTDPLERALVRRFTAAAGRGELRAGVDPERLGF